MEEKTDNIDILERLEYFEPDDLVECAMYRECIEGVKTLIAENKELKEEVERQGVARAIEEDYIEKNFINKNEIKEEIQELKNMKIDGEVFKTAVNYAIKILQSLLGKE